jgi:protein-S-isoprenylcysteine O-methyltransferase Ste14
MALAATVLAVCWFLSAFVLRIAIQVRRHRDTGVRANAGPPLSIGWWVRLLFTSSVIAIAVGPGLVAVDLVPTITALDLVAVQSIGLIVTIAGIAVTFWAQLAMGRSWRIGVDPGERTELVTSGIFAVVRNPIFSAMAVTALGLTLMAPNPVSLVGLGLLVVVLELQVRAVEEPYLRQVHGPAYDRYAAGVGRFTPRLVSGGGDRKRRTATPAQTSSTMPKGQAPEAKP